MAIGLSSMEVTPDLPSGKTEAKVVLRDKNWRQHRWTSLLKSFAVKRNREVGLSWRGMWGHEKCFSR